MAVWAGLVGWVTGLEWHGPSWLRLTHENIIIIIIIIHPKTTFFIIGHQCVTIEHKCVAIGHRLAGLNSIAESGIISSNDMKKWYVQYCS